LELIIVLLDSLRHSTTAHTTHTHYRHNFEIPVTVIPDRHFATVAAAHRGRGCVKNPVRDLAALVVLE